MWPAADTEPSVAFVTDAAPVERILTHIGEPPTCASDCPARGPHACADVPAPMPDWNLLGQPEPDFEFEFEFDQRISWQPASATRAGGVAVVLHLPAAPLNPAPWHRPVPACTGGEFRPPCGRVLTDLPTPPDSPSSRL